MRSRLQNARYDVESTLNHVERRWNMLVELLVATSTLPNFAYLLLFLDVLAYTGQFPMQFCICCLVGRLAGHDWS
jgi:hypothetical protein